MLVSFQSNLNAVRIPHSSDDGRVTGPRGLLGFECPVGRETAGMSVGLPWPLARFLTTFRNAAAASEGALPLAEHFTNPNYQGTMRP